jgi:quinoprotein glucose dehydrogenase
LNTAPAVDLLIPSAHCADERRAHPERETTEQRGAPYAMSRQFFLSPAGRPCVAPPWGELVAVSAVSGEIVWRTTLGDLREAAKVTLPNATGAPSLGGPITTATGLVFVGATMDPFIRAFTTGDGKEVWRARLPTSARATPLLFTDSAGAQTIVIAAGGHDSPLSKLDTKLVAFKLR